MTLPVQTCGSAAEADAAVVLQLDGSGMFCAADPRLDDAEDTIVIPILGGISPDATGVESISVEVDVNELVAEVVMEASGEVV